MRLAPAPAKYDRASDQQLRNALASEDERNMKRDRDNALSGRIVMQSPDGTWYAMTVANGGTTAWTAI